MANKLSISNSHISIDLSEPVSLEQFYPIHFNRKKTIAQVSTRHLPEVLKMFRGIDESNVGDSSSTIQMLFWQEVSARRRINGLLQNGPTGSPVVTTSLTLMPHQQLGREIAAIRDRYAFYYDTRTGKTPMSLAIIYDDLQKNPDHKWLIIAPLILLDNAWIEDAAVFVPDIKVVNCHGTTKAQRLRSMQQDANIYLTNIESFASYKEHFDTMDIYGSIVDESSCMRSPKSKQSKALVGFAQQMKRFYLLSGTPASNGEYEYFMQLRAIDYYSVPSSYTQFKEHYFVNTSYNPQFEKLQLRPDKRDELMAQIKKYALYVDKEDVLQTPGRTFIEIPIKMPNELVKHYRKLKNDLYLEIGDHQITAPSAAAKLNKLNQVTSGFIIDTQAVKENKFYADSNATERYLLDKYRFDKLVELLNSPDCVGKQVLIWANYRAEFEIIKSYLGERCMCVYGATSLAEKTDAIQRFKAGKVQYLIANPASADKGLTLTNTHIAIYFSLSWSYELFKQSMERIYGSIQKQPEHCYYYILLAEHSIDEVLYRDVLQGKCDASTAVLNHLKGC